VPGKQNNTPPPFWKKNREGGPFAGKAAEPGPDTAEIADYIKEVFMPEEQVPLPPGEENAEPVSAEPAAAAPTPDAGEHVIDTTTPSLEEQLREAQLAAQEHHDAWLRARADMENVRRRAQDDVAKASKFAVEKFAVELLAVKDSLEAALTDPNADAAKVKEGVDITLRQLVSVFTKFNLAEINPAGEKFDPNKHQAISMVEAEADPNTVVHVMQKGYTLHERVIRPAMVMVAKPKA
jgi:molecular chaperone GrpE